MPVTQPVRKTSTLQGGSNVRICIPVNQDLGPDSPVCAHFGSAPFFLFCDTETGATRAIANTNQHHGHGMCQPLAALAGNPMDAIVVGGIGMGALNKLRAAGIGVYLAQHATAGATVAAFQAGTLAPVNPDMACAHHGHHHGGH